MDQLQNSTETKVEAEIIQQFGDDQRYQSLIDYKAMNGVITDPEGNMAKMSMQALADALSVDRTTLYGWMKRDGFWDAVNDRRKELSPMSRLARMHEVWYLSALKPGNDGYKDRQLWLANFDPNFRMPTEKVEHDLGSGFADLIAAHRNRQIKERNVIDVNPDQS